MKNQRLTIAMAIAAGAVLCAPLAEARISRMMTTTTDRQRTL